jgi:hypothetical protein
MRRCHYFALWSSGRRLPYCAMLGEQGCVVIYAHVAKLELETTVGVRGVVADNIE